MITVLEEIKTGVQKNGRELYRRVYLVADEKTALPTDAAPGSVALIRSGECAITKMLFPDGAWARI